MTDRDSEPTLGRLVEQLSEQTSRLVRAEVALAKAEVAQKAKSSGIGIGLFAAAGAIALYALGVLIWSAVLGLGDIGPRASLPVMEGKAALFKRFGGVDAWPVVLDTRDTDEIVAIVRAIAPAYGGINLEDIAAPAASRSNSGCATCSTSRCSTTTSTARRSACWPP